MNPLLLLLLIYLLLGGGGWYLGGPFLGASLGLIVMLGIGYALLRVYQTKK